MTEPEASVATVHAAGFAQLTARQVHDLLKLRVEVFVVEQQCAYPEIDGLDVEPGTEHLWVEVDGELAAYLRILRDPGRPGGRVIGRVVTARACRGCGHATRLMQAALGRIGESPMRLSAQTYLEAWYGGFGFVRAGPDYLDDGIPHLPMERQALTR